jgi:hypothetical protein
MASCKRPRGDSEDSEPTADLSWLWSDYEQVRLVALPRGALRMRYFSCTGDSSTDDSEVGIADQEASQERPESTRGHSQPLFAGSRVSSLEAYIMIFQYALRHHLTAKASSELLLLLQVLLPAVNLLPKSLYLLKKFFLKAFPNICVTEHYYCQVCHTPRDPSSLHQCSNELCVSRKFDRFITVPLAPQLQEMMKGMFSIIIFYVNYTKSCCRQVHLVLSKREAFTA